MHAEPSAVGVRFRAKIDGQPIQISCCDILVY
jgi:hypothetical protein